MHVGLGARVPVNANANGTVGERITIALVLLGFVAEMLSDNVSWKPTPQPMTIEACVDLCQGQGGEVERVEGWVCACR